MKEIYFRLVYLEPGMFFNFNYKLNIFMTNELNKNLYIEKIPLRKGMKTDTTDYTLVLNISCHSNKFTVTGPTMYRKDQEIDFYLNIPYKKIPTIKEQAVYFLSYVELGLIDILREDAEKYAIHLAISKVKQSVTRLDDNNELLEFIED
ncbi:hypothetical protein RO21_02045 [[Actinobacillus] muris]|uniref:Uncharacterized protein n=1 Tax=Muribacter muris TaxID=67855 RepID=A0A0J5P9K2_9PAST|nr:hypothetical protein [Muribacter muris]KMK52219.1 hypothetical protein RO21_02045 [[Actinobacillus] muris] [Muribacter muris]